MKREVDNSKVDNKIFYLIGYGKDNQQFYVLQETAQVYSVYLDSS